MSAEHSSVLSGVAFSLCIVTPWWLALSVLALVVGGDGAWSPLIGGGFVIGVAASFAAALWVIERRDARRSAVAEGSS